MKCFYLLTLCALFFTGHIHAQPGCTDPLATNYNSSATINDGSCIYTAASVSPDSSFNLSGTLPETSGLIKWSNQIWTHNDNTDINLYSLDTTDGTIIQSYSLTSSANIDWEEVSQDSSYVYVGDFGNNANGNRTDLKILRIEKNSILLNSPLMDTINFSYPDQTDFTPTGSNNTDFDCEAFVVSGDSIYLFTKQWIANKTRVYSLPKIPGSYTAILKDSFDVQGLITGAVLLESERLIALSGYSSLLQPFVFLLYDFNSADFFSGNKRKISVSLPFHQMEGITTTNGLKYYMANEYFSQLSITTPQKFHIFNLGSFLANYLNSLPQGISRTITQSNISVYPNPVYERLSVACYPFSGKEKINIYNAWGKLVFESKIRDQESEINIAGLPCGMYFLRIGEGDSVLKVIKK